MHQHMQALVQSKYCQHDGVIHRGYQRRTGHQTYSEGQWNSTGTTRSTSNQGTEGTVRNKAVKRLVLMFLVLLQLLSILQDQQRQLLVKKRSVDLGNNWPKTKRNQKAWAQANEGRS